MERQQLFETAQFLGKHRSLSVKLCTRTSRIDDNELPTLARRKFLQPNTFENRVLKSFLGFCAGALLTVLLNLVLVRIYQTTSFVLFLVVFACGTFLMLGAAFSDTVRCLILLTLPQLFSSECVAELRMLYVGVRDARHKIIEHRR